MRTHSLTPGDVATLERLSGETSDAIRWTVSSSAIVRALVRYAGKPGVEWAREQLFPLVEKVIQSGTVWGRRKRRVEQKNTTGQGVTPALSDRRLLFRACPGKMNPR
jgi:hypothetical protein